MNNKTIVSNQIECLKCGDRPYSAHRHDFKWCECQSVAVDGGMDYLKRLGEPNNYKNISIVLDTEIVENMINEIQLADERGCNYRGILYTILRSCRDHGLLKIED